MKNKLKRKIIIFALILTAALFAIAMLSIFFDEAVIARKGTIYHVASLRKVVALTFDDGPSPVWTPQILDELKKEGIKATFFMLGEHAAEYPDVARRVAKEGHEIGNHTFDHHVLLYYKKGDMAREIRDAEVAIRNATGQTTRYFRPPKAWLTKREKRKVKEMGYKIILWSLNSKDWVTFDDKYIIKYLTKNIRPGDIILFHDSGGIFSAEGGNRSETVKAIQPLAEQLKKKGYSFLTISELLKEGNGG